MLVIVLGFVAALVALVMLGGALAHPMGPLHRPRTPEQRREEALGKMQVLRTMWLRRRTLGEPGVDEAYAELEAEAMHAFATHQIGLDDLAHALGISPADAYALASKIGHDRILEGWEEALI